jgi:hypothetical protein
MYTGHCSFLNIVHCVSDEQGEQSFHASRRDQRTQLAESARRKLIACTMFKKLQCPVYIIALLVHHCRSCGQLQIIFHRRDLLDKRRIDQL